MNSMNDFSCYGEGVGGTNGEEEVAVQLELLGDGADVVVSIGLGREVGDMPFETCDQGFKSCILLVGHFFSSFL